MPALPPWLDVSPAQFGQAAAEGARLRLERAQLQQSAAESAARLGMEQQRLADSERQAAMDNQIRQQQIAANFQRAQTQTAMTQAYRQAMIGLGRQRLDATVARTIQAHQTAAALLNQRQQVAAYKTAHPDATTAELMSLFPGVPPNYIAALDKSTAPKEVQATAKLPDDAGSVRGTPAQIYSLLGTNTPAALQPETAPATPAAPAASVPAMPANTTPFNEYLASLNKTAAPAGGTGFIGTPGGANQFVNPAAAFQAAASTAPQTTAKIPQAAIDYLTKNPAAAAQFDAKYGQGASRQYLNSLADIQ
jgi:transcriptional regulator with XRE-family HTH domain